jgi:PilZ domain
MTRRESVRVLVFARARLIGADRSLRCAVVDLSASGAMLTVTARVPAPPLRLELELGGEKLVLPIETQRASPDGGVAVAFAQPHSEQLHHLIAVEQRRALAQHRVNISERRLPPAFRQPPEDSGS